MADLHWQPLSVVCEELLRPVQRTPLKPTLPPNASVGWHNLLSQKLQIWGAASKKPCLRIQKSGPVIGPEIGLEKDPKLMSHPGKTGVGLLLLSPSLCLQSAN